VTGKTQEIEREYTRTVGLLMRQHWTFPSGPSKIGRPSCCGWHPSCLRFGGRLCPRRQLPEEIPAVIATQRRQSILRPRSRKRPLRSGSSLSAVICAGELEFAPEEAGLYICQGGSATWVKSSVRHARPLLVRPDFPRVLIVFHWPGQIALGRKRQDGCVPPDLP
jgi:hypothetical protein